MKQTTNLNFKEKKSYFKERQELYELMQSINEFKTVKIDDETFSLSNSEDADHLFIWFDRKPFVANYHKKIKQYMIGNQTFQLRSIKELSKVIAFVNKQ